jgi:hypothetical protein
MPISTNIPKDSLIYSVKILFEKNNFPKILALIFKINLCWTYYLVTVSKATKMVTWGNMVLIDCAYICK